MIRLLLLILIYTTSASGASVSETFEARTRLDTTASPTAVWNQSFGKLHSTLEVVNFKPGWTAKAVDVGDGSHGSFELSRYSVFSQNGDISGNVIRLDPSYSELKVTNFTLDAGWTLEPAGTSPLIIRSLSDVTVNGLIWCHGRNGSPNSIGIGGAGATGRCGGKDGGKGGNTGGGITPDSGTSVGGGVTGGGAGTYNAGANNIGGGGGGSWTATAGGVGAGGGFGGAVGASQTDPDFAISPTGGGAGGGGGAGNGTDGGTGGGAGGGAVIIHAVRDVVVGSSGYILADGGNGGTPTGTSGRGGGGGGGSILIFAGGKYNIFNTDASGAVRAAKGNNALAGGGGPGRNWAPNLRYNLAGGTGTYLPGEEAPINTSTGDVQYTTTTQSVTSTAIDLSSTLATVDSITTSPASTDFTITYAGSNDNFISDNTGFVSSLSTVANKRYIKFKAQITCSTPTSPTMLDTLNINYTANQKTQFDFKAAGCGVVTDLSRRAGQSLGLGGRGPSGPSPTAADIWPLLLPLCLILILRKYVKSHFDSVQPLR